VSSFFFFFFFPATLGRSIATQYTHLKIGQTKYVMCAGFVSGKRSMATAMFSLA
jgi:hypothetical protein